MTDCGWVAVAEYYTPTRLREYGAHASWLLCGLLSWWHVVFQASMLAVWGPVAANFLLGQGLPFRRPYDIFQDCGKFYCGGD